MAVKIRLARGGRKKIAFFSIVATDSHNARDGRFIEKLGTYDPQANPKQFNINTARIGYWIEQGAEISETVANLMRQDKTAERIAAVSEGKDATAVVRAPERTRKAKKSKTAAAA